MSERTQGIVKWYSLAKGYGFIRRIDSEQTGDDEQTGEELEDIFVHHSAVTGEPLAEDERVSFEIAEGPKGLKALDVRRAVDDPA